MTRPNKITYYMEMAKAASLRSTCLKNRVGVVIVKDDAIISTGYNGAPRGRNNCIDLGSCYRIEHDIPSGERYEKCLPGYAKIMTEEGSMTIEKYYNHYSTHRLLPRVWSFDAANRKFVLQHAIARLTRKTNMLAYVSSIINDTVIGEFHCTPEHLIMVCSDTVNGREYTYKQARDIKSTDTIVGCYETPGLTMSEFKRCINKVQLFNRGEDLAVYDLTMEDPDIPNFCAEMSPGHGAVVHNCRSVHGEMNAIIDASRNDMIHSTMYIYQYDVLNDRVRHNPGCCQMCQRMIINAGIEEVIFADPAGICFNPEYKYGYRIQKVPEWVIHESDDSVG